MEKGKTIRQIAEELGVSKQAVQKRISREPLHSSVYAYIDKVGGVLYIAHTGEKLIKQAFLKDDRIQIGDNQPTTLYTPLSIPVSTPTDKLYEILKEELEAKNKQIEELTKELAEEREYSRKQGEKLAVLADQAQKLQFAQMQPVIAAEKEVHEEEIMPQEKPGFWKRLFGNKE
jgi:transcriptional regulator with XRE-family HTH domain